MISAILKQGIAGKSVSALAGILLKVSIYQEYIKYAGVVSKMPHEQKKVLHSEKGIL